MREFHRTILSFLFGLLLGVVAAVLQLRPHPPLEIVEDPREPDIPVVTVFGIRDGVLEGQARGEVRVVAGDRVIPLDGSGNFLIVDRAVLTNIVSVSVPTGMRFVASKRGEKYYSIEDPRAAQIVPENRLYFQDSASAERAGYVR